MILKLVKSSALKCSVRRALSTATGAAEPAASIIASHSISKVEAHADASRFFELSNEDIKKHFPTGLNKNMQTTFDMVGKRHFMLRQPTAEIISTLTSWPENAKNAPPAFIIDGERGTGKSVALTQIVHFARENGWIVLHVPKARSWCHEAPYVTKSIHSSDMFDIDVVGNEILNQLIECHGDQLGEISLTEDYGDLYYPHSFEKKPKSTSEFDKSTLSLLDVAHNGLKDELLSCTAVVHIRNELAKVTKYPVLIAVDEYNTWFQKTAFGYEGIPVAPHDITLINALSDVDAEGFISNKKLSNGLFIGATTENYPSSFKFKSQVNYRPLRKSMRTYTKDELNSIVTYYKSVDFIKDEMKESDITYLKLMTKAVPLGVFKRACTM